MASSGMWRLVDLVRTDVSEKRVPSFMVERIHRLIVTANVPSSRILSTLKMGATRFSEMSVLKRPITEDGIAFSYLMNLVRNANMAIVEKYGVIYNSILNLICSLKCHY
jgi:hypothetical protein